MVKIKIKRNNSSDCKVSEDLKVDLRNKSEEIQKQPSRKWLFLSILLILVLIASWTYFSLSKKDFSDLVPEQEIFLSLLNPEALYQQISPVYSLPNNRVGNYLKQANLDSEEDIISLFKDKTVFALYPSNFDVSFPFILILERKESEGKIKGVLGRLEQSLKNDYNLSFKIYRQTEITVLSPLNKEANQYFYTQIEGYFLVSNSQEILEKTMDKIID